MPDKYKIFDGDEVYPSAGVRLPTRAGNIKPPHPSRANYFQTRCDRKLFSIKFEITNVRTI
jgi:hypothetical protein